MFTNRSKRRNREINISTINNIKATIENECKRKKGESIDLQTKLRIVLFLETTNDSQREIARKCNVGKSTVFRINKKLNQFKVRKNFLKEITTRIFIFFQNLKTVFFKNENI